MSGSGEIEAKLVYYGASGAGKSANIACIHRKLKKGHRGELRTESSGSSTYDVLPVQLGQIRGFTTSICVYAVPGGEEAAEVRCDLVKDADGVVFVADLRPDRYNATLDSLRELQSHLRRHGRSLREILLVIQYNHRDEVDENAVDRLHRSIKLRPAASFEAVATEGTGVLPCLTTISKLILADLRKRADHEAATPADRTEPSTPAAHAPEPQRTEPAPTRLEMRALTTDEEGSKRGFAVKSAGPAEASADDIELPIRLVHQESGEEVSLSIRIQLR